MAPERVPVFNFISSGTLAVDWAFRIDTLTVVMLVVVNTVSSLVHLYSMGYMADDPDRLSLFDLKTDIIQGVEMGRPSRLHATAQRTSGGVTATVGGGCVPVLRGEATI